MTYLTTRGEDLNPPKSAIWRGYQYRYGGNRRAIAIWKFPEVGVADAREGHFEMRTMIERGVAPLDSRRQLVVAQKQIAAESRSGGDNF